MSRRQDGSRPLQAHPTARGRDGVELLAQLRAERDEPRCGVCEAALDTPAPLCRACDTVLRQELHGTRGRRS